MSRPVVVVLATYAIDPPNSGGQQRIFHLARGLARHFTVEVVSLVALDWPETRREIAPGVTETTVARSGALEEHERQISDTLGGAYVGDFVVGQFPNALVRYREQLRAISHRPAVVVLCQPYLFPPVRMVFDGIPFVLDAHDVAADLKRQLLPDSATGLKVLRDVEAIERDAVEYAALVTACSIDDLGTLRARYDLTFGRSAVVSNGVDTAAVSYVAPDKRAKLERRWLDTFTRESGRGVDHLGLFVGSLHQPNTDAASFLAQTGSLLEHTVVVLVGSHVRGLINDLPANVVPLGVLPESMKRALLRCTGVALNPVVSGSGTNLKFLDYLAAGAPTVSTPYGARGLAARSDAHFIAADLEHFSEGVQSVLAGGPRIEAMSAAGRALVEEKYDWTRIADEFADRVLEVSAA